VIVELADVPLDDIVGLSEMSTFSKLGPNLLSASWQTQSFAPLGATKRTRDAGSRRPANRSTARGLVIPPFRHHRARPPLPIFLLLHDQRFATLGRSELHGFGYRGGAGLLRSGCGTPCCSITPWALPISTWPVKRPARTQRSGS